MSQPQNKSPLRFEIGDIWIDPAGLDITNQAYAFTNIDADVRIYLGDQLFFDETLCIVEFANALRNWFAAMSSQQQNFRFESADDEEPNILSFETLGDSVKINSAWQKFTTSEPLAKVQVLSELERFVPDAILRCQSDLGVNVDRWIKSTT